MGQGNGNILLKSFYVTGYKDKRLSRVVDKLKHIL